MPRNPIIDAIISDHRIDPDFRAGVAASVPILPPAGEPDTKATAGTSCAGHQDGLPPSLPAGQAGAGFSSNALQVLHAQLLGKLLALRGPRCPLDTDPEDFEEIGRYMGELLEAIKGHYGQVAAYAGLLGAGNVDELIGDADAAISDLQGDFRGTMDRAAERIRDDRYDGIAMRGPMHRQRGR